MTASIPDASNLDGVIRTAIIRTTVETALRSHDFLIWRAAIKVSYFRIKLHMY